jgi:hypothetical protein
MNGKTNLSTHYSATGPGRHHYERLRQLIAPRLTVEGPIKTDNVYKLVRGEFGSYVVIAACFRSIMVDLAAQGKAEEIGRGTWYIGTRPPQRDPDKRGPGRPPKERPGFQVKPLDLWQPKDSALRTPPDFTPEPAPNSQPRRIIYQGVDLGPSIFTGTRTRETKIVPAWYSKIYQRWMNL